MKKGQRPSKHIRKVHTKKGTKKKVINRNIVKKKKVYIPPGLRKVKFHKNKQYVATGIDEEGRLQHIYPQDFRDKQNKDKFNRVDNLSKKINNIIKGVTKDADAGNNEARAVYAIYITGFRPGTQKDTHAKVKAKGLTNLTKKDVKTKNGRVYFKFIGKKGVPIEKVVKDKRVFKYVSSNKKGKLFGTDDDRVRYYFKKKTGGKFKIKDLRTLKGNTLAKKLTKKNTRAEVGRAVATELNNTPTVALGSYINPKVVA